MPSSTARFFTPVLHSLAWILLAISLAGPRTPDPITDEYYSGKSDILLLLDVSRSMQATDIRPNRLKRARIEIAQLLDMLKGERVSSMVYAARPHLLHPFTRDYRLVRFYLENLQQNLLPTEGSELRTALTQAQEYLRGRHNPTAAILLVTDGDLDQAQLEGLNKSEFPLYILAIGTEDGSPLPSAGGGWLQVEGKPVYSATRRALLEKLAQQQGGKAVMMSDDDSDLIALYRKGILSQAGAGTTAKTTQQRWYEWYPYTLLPAFLILVFLSLPRAVFSTSPATVPALLVLLLLLAPVVTVLADERAAQQGAQQAFQQQRFEAARRLYAQVPDFAGRMGEGVSAYRLKDYTHAIVQFTQAFLLAADDHQRAWALYNLGNSHFQRKEYARALDCFRDALRYNPQLITAKHNHDFTAALIRDLPRTVSRAPSKRLAGGRGPRTGTADSIGTGSFAMDPEDNEQNRTALEGHAAEIKAADNQIGSGERDARTHDGKAAADSQRWQTVSAQALFQAKQQADTLREKQVLFWKSLFESEEGFPAPVETPLPITGVRPW